ncbi:MAG: hypothetical protein ACFE0O_12195 [Opitutales bacterium]
MPGGLDDPAIADKHPTKGVGGKACNLSAEDHNPDVVQIMQRFLPTLSQVREAADQLPDAETSKTDEMTVKLNGSESKRTITFERVPFKSRTRGLIFRWVYTGKVMVK